jgi:methionyl-tRNA formyltransferase
MKKLRVAILSHGGVERVLNRLSELESVELVGVFVETEVQPERSLREKIKRSILYDGYLQTSKKMLARLFQRDVESAKELRAIRDGQRELQELSVRLKVPYHSVNSYHSSEAIKLLKDTAPDLGILYGTNIVRESVFNIPKLGTINLHKGLAPYYRGGPPVFWELLNGEKEVGLTVHFVAAAVDAGDIVLQETVPLEYDFSKYGLDYDSFLRDWLSTSAEPSAGLVVEAVRLISEENHRPIKQDISVGKRYRLPTKKEKDLLLATLINRQNQEKRDTEAGRKQLSN